MLQALVDYARQEHLVAKPGLKPKTIRWLLVFSSNGKYLNVQDLRGNDRRSRGREFRACPDLTQQEMVAVGAGCRHFLVDSLDVVALLTKDGNVNNKLAAKHTFFVNLLEQASSFLPVLAPIAAALADEAMLASVQAKLAEAKARPTELATFAVANTGGGASVIVEQDVWHNWWLSYRAELAAKRQAKGTGKGQKSPGRGQKMRCLLSGELVDPHPTHNKIEGLSDVGGLSMGDALTSFNKDAFSSFGLQQGANAAMSEAMVKSYTSALNHLIRHRSHRLAGVKVAYWYSGHVEQDDDVLAEVLQGFALARGESNGSQNPQDDSPSVADRAQAESRARRVLNAIRTGEHPDLGDFRYHVLTLSANSGRVVIRDWMEGRFEELAAAIDAWFDDLSIVSRDGRTTIRSHKFAGVLAAPLRDLKDAAAPLVASMWRCAVKRQPIPHQVMVQTLHRVRIDLIQDEAPRHARLGLLKAFCIRDERVPKMTPKLKEHETNVAYLCGRIMAILAAIQRTALPNVGAGVVQRYYAAASTTPALVLGRLVRTAQIAHLPKIEGEGLRHWFEHQLAEVWLRLSQAPPRVLTLEEQTLFAMGYYHQSARRFQRNNGKSAEEAAPISG